MSLAQNIWNYNGGLIALFSLSYKKQNKQTKEIQQNPKPSFLKQMPQKSPEQLKPGSSLANSLLLAVPQPFPLVRILCRVIWVGFLSLVLANIFLPLSTALHDALEKIRLRPAKIQLIWLRSEPAGNRFRVSLGPLMTDRCSFYSCALHSRLPMLLKSVLK